MMKDTEKGINQGHGFVQYIYTESVKQVLDQYESHRIRAKWVS